MDLQADDGLVFGKDLGRERGDSRHGLILSIHRRDEGCRASQRGTDDNKITTRG